MSTKRLCSLVVALALPLALVLFLSLVLVSAPVLASMSGSTVNAVTPNPISPGAPVNLCFNVAVSSPDDEYMARFDVNLPDGWTVNSVANTPSNFGQPTTQGIDAGNVVYWQTSGYPSVGGAWSNGTFNFCANVTALNGTGAPWSLPWNIIGENYGAPPHSVSGAVNLDVETTIHLTLAKSVMPATAVPYHGVATYTLILNNSGVLSDTAVFLTDTLPAAVDFGWWIDNPGASVSGDEITWHGTVTDSTVLTFTFAVTHTGSYADIVVNTAAFSGTTQAGQATATFTVESNPDAPVLAPIGDQMVDELTELAFTAFATNPVPAVLTFTLDAGSVGAITPAGDFSWTPSEAAGPGVHTATVRVTNGEYDDFETVNITVNEVNTAPVMAHLGYRVVNELETLVISDTTTDADLPPNPLTYWLDEGSVGEIDAMTGRYTWTPAEADGFDVYTATLHVSDGALQDSEFVIIIVNEVYQPPVLQPIGDKRVDALTPFHFTARVTSLDIPLRPITYTLAPGSVGIIDAHTGLFNWTPGALPETYTTTVQVSDGTVTDTDTIHLTVNVDTPGVGHWVVVANNSQSDFRIVNTTDNTVYGPFLEGQLGTDGGGRFDVTVTPDGRTALFSNFGDSKVFLVDMTNPIAPSLITSVTVPFFAEDMDVSADGRYALVTDGGFSTEVAVIDIPAATLVYTANLVQGPTPVARISALETLPNAAEGHKSTASFPLMSPEDVIDGAQAQAVEVAPDGTVIVADYWNGAIHTLLLDNQGRLNALNTYTYTYPGWPITNTEYALRPVNLGLSPDGQTLIVCSTTTTTVGIYRLVSPGVLTFTGVVTGLEGAYDHYDFGPGTVPHGAVQSVAFNAAGDKAYALLNGLFTAGTTITEPIVDTQLIGVLNITGPGQVSLEAGGVVTVPHHGTSQLFGVDVIAIAGNKAYVGYPTVSGAADPETGETTLAVVDLTDYSVTTTLVFTSDVSIPTGVAALPLRLDLHQAVSDPTPLPGQLVTYTLMLANAGPQIAEITLRDMLPSGVDFVGPITLFPANAGIVGSTPLTLTTNLVILAYQRITVTFPVRIGTLLPGTVVTNTVWAESPKFTTSARAQATFTVIPLPAAVAGAPQTVLSGDKVTLDGSNSIGRTPLTYSWQQIGGLPVTLTGASNVTATFTAPYITQTQVLTFALTVTDRQNFSSEPSIVAITVEPYRVRLPIVLK
jgi:uncharacterized repeat protein (TIGR01451 family)